MKHKAGDILMGAGVNQRDFSAVDELIYNLYVVVVVLPLSLDRQLQQCNATGDLAMHNEQNQSQMR